LLYSRVFGEQGGGAPLRIPQVKKISSPKKIGGTLSGLATLGSSAKHQE